MNHIIKGKRVLALFDILGFKNHINKAKLRELPEFIDLTISNTKKSLVSDDIVSFISFSDTIVLFGINGEDLIESNFLIISSSNLINSLASNGILVRGALTYGDIFINQNKNTILGPALVKAYEYEKNQDWVGGIVDPDFEEMFVEGISTAPENLKNNLVAYCAPFKSGFIKEYRCIGWMHRQKLTKEKLYRLFFKDRQRIKHEVNRKFLNTLAFLEFCREKYSQDFER